MVVHAFLFVGLGFRVQGSGFENTHTLMSPVSTGPRAAVSYTIGTIGAGGGNVPPLSKPLECKTSYPCADEAWPVLAVLGVDALCEGAESKPLVLSACPRSGTAFNLSGIVTDGWKGAPVPRRIRRPVDVDRLPHRLARLLLAVGGGGETRMGDGGDGGGGFGGGGDSAGEGGRGGGGEDGEGGGGLGGGGLCGVGGGGGGRGGPGGDWGGGGVVERS